MFLARTLFEFWRLRRKAAAIRRAGRRSGKMNALSAPQPFNGTFEQRSRTPVADRTPTDSMTSSTLDVAVCCSSDSERSSRALTQFVEQPRVLDGDDGLVGESLHQLDLFVCKRLWDGF